MQICALAVGVPMFIVFRLTQLGIEPQSTVSSLADALSTRPLIGIDWYYSISGSWLVENINLN